MSFSTIKHNKATANKALKYIFQKKKTAAIRLINLDEARPVYVQFRETNELYGKNNTFNERKYYHGKISFAEEDWEKNDGKVTPELALDICQEIVAEFFPGYEVAMSVHTDTDNIHVHFIVNSVCMETGKKLDMRDYEYTKFKDRVKEVYERNGLKTLDWRTRVEEKRADKRIDEYIPGEEEVVTFVEEKIRERHGSPEHPGEINSKFSWKDEIKTVVDYALDYAASEEEFSSILQHYNIETPRNTAKTISYKHPNHSKSVRGDTLGDNYTKSYIVQKVAENAKEQADEAALSEKIAELDEKIESNYPSLAFLINSAADVNNGVRVDAEKAELEKAKKNIDWIKDRREKNYEKAYKTYLKYEEFIGYKLNDAGWHNKEDWKDLNFLLNQTRWQDESLNTEKDKMSKLLDKWNVAINSEGTASKKEVREAEGYVRWSGCELADLNTYEELKSELQMIECQIKMNAEMRDVLADTAQEWNKSNKLISAQREFDKAVKNFKWNVHDYKKLKRNRKKLKEISDNCYHSASRRAGEYSYYDAMEAAVYSGYGMSQDDPWYKYDKYNSEYKNVRRKEKNRKSRIKDATKGVIDAAKNLHETKKEIKEESKKKKPVQHELER